MFAWEISACGGPWLDLDNEVLNLDKGALIEKMVFVLGSEGCLLDLVGTHLTPWVVSRQFSRSDDLNGNEVFTVCSDECAW